MLFSPGQWPYFKRGSTGLHLEGFNFNAGFRQSKEPRGVPLLETKRDWIPLKRRPSRLQALRIALGRGFYAQAKLAAETQEADGTQGTGPKGSEFAHVLGCQGTLETGLWRHAFKALL